MNYTVDTSDGAMTYGSLEQLQDAVRLRLVQPQDLVHPDGASPLPVAMLVRERRAPQVLTAARTMVRLQGPPARPERRWPTVVAVFAATLTLLHLELPRLTVMVPWLFQLPLLTGLFPGAAPGGEVPLLSALVSPWLSVGWAHLLAGAVLAFVLARGLTVAAIVSAGYLALVGGYFAATDRPLVAGVIGVGAVALIGVLVRRRYGRN